MGTLSRRDALRGTAAALGWLAACPTRAKSAPNERVNVGVLGASRGAALARQFATLPDSQVVAICEVDEGRGYKLAEEMYKTTAGTPAGSAPGGASTKPDGEAKGGDDVIDAEYRRTDS